MSNSDNCWIFLAFVDEGLDHPEVKRRALFEARKEGRGEVTRIYVDPSLEPDTVKVVKSSEAYYLNEKTGRTFNRYNHRSRGNYLTYIPVVCEVAVAPLIRKPKK